jgi:hypothetical protein
VRRFKQSQLCLTGPMPSQVVRVGIIEKVAMVKLVVKLSRRLYEVRACFRLLVIYTSALPFIDV